ncbi:hypothetical protein E8E14_006151 [Neopestalotiopsis sp. 37M]|nr:hypothetical protein E8E14_006151 [Neopestalotiopsis sp. 37M]
MSQERLLENLSINVIGAGFGGLACAIELASRGAHVRIFESYPDTKKQGDVIQIPANATRLMAKWGNILQEITHVSACPDTMTISNQNGKVLLNQQLHTSFDGYPNLYSHRGGVQQRMMDYAISLGVQVHFGTPVTEITESDDAATLIAGGKTWKSDAIIGADGVRSQTRCHILGVDDKAKKSGFAVYRSWFSLDLLRQDPITEAIATSEKDLFKIWIAKDTHAILTTNKAANAATCFVTHKDQSDISEDWHVKGEVEDMLACVEGWDEQLRHIIESITPECLIDHKLLWRDPVPQWVSPGGRICIVGDAAHPHLATSGTGAAQAIEDGACIASLLQKTGARKEDIPLAFRAYQKLRYERTSLTQRMGWETRHVWHQTDWEAVAANPDMLKFPQPEWLLGSDASEYAEEKFKEVKSYLEKGTPFTSTNVPPGHVHKDWSIEEMLSHEGKAVATEFYQTRD